MDPRMADDRMIAVPVKLAMEAVRRKKREAAAAPKPQRRGVAIPFHKVRTPAEAHTHARILMAKERALGHDLSDRATPEEAAEVAEAILRQSQRRLDLHLNTVGATKKLACKTDLSISSTDYWTSLSQEFRELYAETGNHMQPEVAFAPQQERPYLPERAASYPLPPQLREFVPPPQPHPPQPPQPHAAAGGSVECGFCHMPCGVRARFCQNCGGPLLGIDPSSPVRRYPYAPSQGTPAPLERGPTPVSPAGMPYNTPASMHVTPAGVSLPYPHARNPSPMAMASAAPARSSPAPVYRSPAAPVSNKPASSAPPSAAPPSTQPSPGPVPDTAVEVNDSPSGFDSVPPPVAPRSQPSPESEPALSGSPAAKKNTAVEVNDAPPSGFFDSTPGSKPKSKPALSEAGSPPAAPEGSPAAKKNTAVEVNDSPPSGFFDSTPGAKPKSKP